MRNLITFASAALGTALLVAGAVVVPAHATSVDQPEAVTATEAPNPSESSAPAEATLEPGSLVSTEVVTSASAIVDGGLQRVRLFSGSVNWSVDGLGINRGTSGDLQVEKPNGATVLAAFLMTASAARHAMPTDLTLAAQPVTFSIEASGSATGFTNFFADVTSIVKPLVDAGSGTVNLTVDEGSLVGPIEGSSLVVVFNDPAVTLASVAIYFGTSDPAGDNFAMDFNALTEPQTQDLRMSLGSAFSFGSFQNSDVSVNGRELSRFAGHVDDCDQFTAGDEDQSNWKCGNSALITVGGVGDSLVNPERGPGAVWSTLADDELYSLAPFVSVGDIAVNVKTSNPTSDDNLFMAVFYLDKIAVFATDDVALAETGSAETSWLVGAGAAFLLLGMALTMATRRRSRHGA